MLILLKKIIYTITFNFSLFLLLMIGLQNSSKKEKVNLTMWQTVNLPVGFIVGASFITGSISGILLTKSSFEEERK